MSRLKFSIFGNCQAPPLRQILQSSTEFSQIYEYVLIKPVHLISQNEDQLVHETFRNLDLIIYQHVSAVYGGNSRDLGTESLLTQLKDSSRAVSLPVAYFTGYNPETISLRNNNGDAVWGSFCNYHDLNILNCYHHGISWQECVSYIQNGANYTSEVLETNVADSLSRLRERERNCDVMISDFIEKNWRKQRLFFNFNHCANLLLLHEANQILHLIGLPSLDPSTLAGCWELLGDIRVIVYPNVRKHFALSFDEELMRIDGRTYTLDRAIRGYFDYYSTHHELVQNNIDFYKRSSNETLSFIASQWPMPYSKLQSSSQEKDAQIGDLIPSREEKCRSINNLLSEFDITMSSITYRVARKLHIVINVVLPLGTKRRHFVWQILKAFAKPTLKFRKVMKRSWTS